MVHFGSPRASWYSHRSTFLIDALLRVYNPVIRKLGRPAYGCANTEQRSLSGRRKREDRFARSYLCIGRGAKL